MTQPDEVSIEDAYAAALTEIGHLQNRVIMGQALISKLKREVSDGPKDPGSGDSPVEFSD